MFCVLCACFTNQVKRYEWNHQECNCSYLVWNDILEDKLNVRKSDTDKKVAKIRKRVEMIVDDWQFGICRTIDRRLVELLRDTVKEKNKSYTHTHTRSGKLRTQFKHNGERQKKEIHNQKEWKRWKCTTRTDSLVVGAVKVAVVLMICLITAELMTKWMISVTKKEKIDR